MTNKITFDDTLMIMGIHDLAIDFYKILGYEHDNTNHKKLYQSHHPTELATWQMACIAFARLRQSDVSEIINGDCND